MDSPQFVNKCAAVQNMELMVRFKNIDRLERNYEEILEWRILTNLH